MSTSIKPGAKKVPMPIHQHHHHKPATAVHHLHHHSHQRISHQENQAILQQVRKGTPSTLHTTLANIASRTKTPLGRILAQARDEHGRNALHLAVELAPAPALKMLTYFQHKSLFPPSDKKLLHAFMNHVPGTSTTTTSTTTSTTTPKGDTPILHACRLACDPDLLRKLVTMGADLAATNDRDWTAVHCVAAGATSLSTRTGGGVGGSKDSPAKVLRYLKAKRGGTLASNCLQEKAKEDGGNTPAHVAARYDQLEAMKALVALTEGKVRLDKNAAGLTPLQVAVASRSMHVAGYLESLGA